MEANKFFLKITRTFDPANKAQELVQSLLYEFDHKVVESKVELSNIKASIIKDVKIINRDNPIYKNVVVENIPFDYYEKNTGQIRISGLIHLSIYQVKS